MSVYFVKQNNNERTESGWLQIENDQSEDIGWNPIFRTNRRARADVLLMPTDSLYMFFVVGLGEKMIFYKLKNGWIISDVVYFPWNWQA